MTDDGRDFEKIIHTRLMRLNASIHGIVAGLIVGLGVFVVTNWLLLRGGPAGPEGEPVIGPHLWLLSNFFIGYSVTFAGSLVGFVYGFVCGFGAGFIMATTYNVLVDMKEKRKTKSAAKHKESLQKNLQETKSSPP